MTSHEKIRPEHLARAAMVYVRQSTMDQVRHNHESRRRQYELADHARALGWKDVAVIDDDLGKSGARSAERAGFPRLVAAVGLGQVGAVVSIEVSRCARNNRDWLPAPGSLRPDGHPDHRCRGRRRCPPAQ